MTCLLSDDAIRSVRQVFWGRIHGILVVPKATLASRRGILVVPEVPPLSQRGCRVVRKAPWPTKRYCRSMPNTMAPESQPRGHVDT